MQPRARGAEGVRGFPRASGTFSKRGLLENRQCAVLPGSPRGPGEPCDPAGMPAQYSTKAGTRLSTQSRVTHGEVGQGLPIGQPLTPLAGQECEIF